MQRSPERQSSYPEPPTTYRLQAPAGVTEASRLPPAGPVGPYLGPQFSLAEVSAIEFPEDERILKLIRAFPVPALAGVEVEAETEAALPRALEEALRARIPGVDWRLRHYIGGPLRKYALLHTSLLAPPDEATGEPMALEICGNVVVAGDVLARGGDWWDYRLTLGERWAETPVPGPLTVRLESAVYANALYSGIGMPLYA